MVSGVLLQAPGAKLRVTDAVGRDARHHHGHDRVLGRAVRVAVLDIRLAKRRRRAVDLHHRALPGRHRAGQERPTELQRIIGLALAAGIGQGHRVGRAGGCRAETTTGTVTEAEANACARCEAKRRE